MQNLIFFGSDQYSQTTLSHLSKHSDFVITHLHDLKSIPPITPGTIGLCASFDHLIPKNIIEKFGGHLYNLHPSLLPQYRNVSPVQYAIALGDTVTGITLFRIAPGIDDGEIVAQISEPILPTDTTPTLTARLFARGAKLFIDHLITPSGPGLAGQSNLPARPGPTGTLIFTHRLTRDSGYIEWPILHKLLQNEPISPSDTKNELLRLRLSRTPVIHDSSPLIHDLMRALNPWPGVWSLVPTKKAKGPELAEGANLRISLVPVIHNSSPMIHISGKPKPITYSDFTKYYL